MSVPVHRREFDLFLSHAHRDRTLVDGLYRWLTEVSGLHVWYDAQEMAGGSLIASGLQEAIERCRGMLLIASPESVGSGWVEKEYNIGVDESARSADFRLIPLRLCGTDADSLIRGISWIDLPDDRLTAEAAAAVLRSLYPGERRPDPGRSRDVYISASWHQQDSASSRAVCNSLVRAGFRLIGDSKDQGGFAGGGRIERIVASCGAFVAVVPLRDGEVATALEGPYRYFMREIDIASGLGVPMIVIADPRLKRQDGDDAGWLRMETQATTCSKPVSEAIERLWDRWRPPPRPHYVFCVLDLDSPVSARGSHVRRIIERVTAMKTVVATEIHDSPLQNAIIRSIREAFLVLADLTDDAGAAFNLNACIEAGMAHASGGNVELIARGVPRRPPFMLRQLQMITYADEVELVGVIHDLARKYRRRVINAEL